MILSDDEKFNVRVYENSDIYFETNDILRRSVNIFFVPILNLTPKFLREHIKRTHISAKEVIENTKTSKALDILYDHGNPHLSKHIVHKIFHSVWFNLDNSKAVRNRLKLVNSEIKNIIHQIQKIKKDIKILSIASGSARAVIQSVRDSDLENHNISITFLDKDKMAIESSRRLVEKLSLKGQFQWVIDTANNFPKYIDGLDIVEVVGLLDYFDSSKTLKILSSIYENLNKGGFLITANISDNPERRFITNVVGWEMIYKKPEDLINLAMRAGFEKENISVFYEPLKIHFIMIAKK